MPFRSETVLKWSLYGGVLALLLLVQAILQRSVSLLGVFPFLYPCIVAVVAMYEGAIPGTVFGLAVGVLCDLTLAVPFPGFYTITLTLGGLLAALVANGLIPSGFFCSLVATALVFFVVDGGQLLLLAAKSESFWPLALTLTLREIGCSLLFSPLVFFPLRAVYRRWAVDDAITGY